MAQLKVTIDQDLRLKLEATAEQSGESLSEEARIRLERAIRDEANFDLETRILGRDVMRLAQLIQRHAEVHWRDHAAARTAFASAFARYLEGLEPLPDGPGKLSAAMAKPGQAWTIGHVLGGVFLHDLALEAKIQKTKFPKMSARQLKKLRQNLGVPDQGPQLELVKPPPVASVPRARKEERKKAEGGTS
jgi:hypothetical protein